MRAVSLYWFVVVVLMHQTGGTSASRQVYVSLDNDGYIASGTNYLGEVTQLVQRIPTYDYYPIQNTVKKFRHAIQPISNSAGGKMVRLCSLAPVGYIKKAFRQGDSSLCGENSVINGEFICPGQANFNEKNYFYSGIGKKGETEINEKANNEISMHGSSLGKSETAIRRILSTNGDFNVDGRANMGRFESNLNSYGGATVSGTTLNGKDNHILRILDVGPTFKSEHDGVNRRLASQELTSYEEPEIATGQQLPIQRTWSLFNPGIFGGLSGSIGANIGASIGAGIGGVVSPVPGATVVPVVSGAGTNGYGGNGFYRYAVGRSGLYNKKINMNTDNNVYLPEDFRVFVDSNGPYDRHYYDQAEDNDFEHYHGGLLTTRQRYSFGLG